MKPLVKLIGVAGIGLAAGLAIVALVLTGLIPIPFGPMAEARAMAERYRPPVTVMYPTKERVVNLADRDTPRFLKVQVTLEFIDRGMKEPPKGEAVKAQQEHFAADMSGYTAIIEDTMTMVLSSKTATQLLDPQGKDILKKELMDRLNKSLFPETPLDAAPDREHERVVAVYFPTFIIQ